jgi:hypothetical protein
MESESIGILGMLGAVLGGLLGVGGGAYGSWCSLKTCQSSEERWHMLRWVAGFWVGVVLFVGLLLLVPQPYNLLLWVPYAPALTWAIVKCNRGQAAIRQRNETQA